jgi:hypothetical protein
VPLRPNNSPIHFPDPGPKDRKASNDPTPTPNTPIRSIDPNIPVHLGDPGKIGRVSNDPAPLKPIDVPLRPIGKIDNGDHGGRGRGDGSNSNGGNTGKLPHIGPLNNNVGHVINPVNTGPLRTPAAVGPRLSTVAVGGKSNPNAIR